MNVISRRHWFVFIALALISFSVWWRYTYPSFAFINLAVDRDQALSIARSTLEEFEPLAREFKPAIVFKKEGQADRYLQMNLGFEGLLKFVREHQFDMFIWHIRFYKTGTKEAYTFSVSSATGEVVEFTHTLEETAETEPVAKEILFPQAVRFLQQKFGFRESDYDLKADLTKTLPNRKEYFFSWNKKNVAIPWSEEEGSNTAFLGTTIKISGTKVLGFSKNILIVPEDFRLHLETKKIIGKDLTLFMRIVYHLLFIAAVYYLISRTKHLAIHSTKRFYIGIFVFAFGLTCLDDLNSIQILFMKYKTTSPFMSFLARELVQKFTGHLLFTAGIIIPALTAESLRLETRPEAKSASFLHYIHSSFLTRSVAQSIFLGYLIAAIMFGLQSSLFEWGQTHLGVWQEQTWSSQFTTSYFPFLTAFTHAFKSSFLEEFMYRMFAIHLGIKIFRNVPIAILFSSLLWGFAHTSYPVFPMWFRGLEMSLIGIFLGVMYIRFGIIPVLVGHFIFNICWHVFGYLLGEASHFHVMTSWFVLLLPFIWAFIAFLLNKPEQEKELIWRLNKSQTFNMRVLKTYLQAHRDTYKNQDPAEMKQTISAQGWDYAVVDQAVDAFVNEERASA